MIRPFRLVATLLFTAAAVLVAAPAAQAATWCSSDKWATWSNGGYTITNDVWGSRRRPAVDLGQLLQQLGSLLQPPNTGGVKSYPHAGPVHRPRPSTLGSVTSSFNVSRAGQRVAYETAYDIWAKNNAYEIMLWMNKYGRGRPDRQPADHGLGGRPHLGRLQGLERLERGVLLPPPRQHQLRYGRRPRDHAWMQAQGWFGDVTLGDVQFGFEITSSSGGKDFVTNSFSVTG